MDIINQSKKTIVVIPSYEPPSSFIDYVKALLDCGVDKIIVVNDGSSENYQHVFNSIYDFDNTILLEYPENRGKGYALKYAFKYIYDNFNEDLVVVTADCDGQHFSDDVLLCGNTAKENPNALILGTRDFSKNNVPSRSRFGNVNTRRLFKLLYGLKITDTQTGLRAFDRSMLINMLKISGDRFEYEMNMLIVLFKQNVQFIEIPIQTIYQPKPSDVNTRSHFKTFSDSIKVYNVLFKNVQTYLLAVIVSGIVELSVFALSQYYLYANLAIKPYLITLLATVTARVVSSIVNFFMNYKLVFSGKSKKSAIRYYTLWLGLLISSYLLTNLFGNVLKLPILIFKLITDLALSIASYRIQTVWVFPHKNNCKRKKNSA